MKRGHKHDGEDINCRICRNTEAKRLISNAVDGLEAALVVLGVALDLITEIPRPRFSTEELEKRRKRMSVTAKKMWETRRKLKTNVTRTRDT